MLNIDSFIGLAWLLCSKMWLEFRIQRISTFIGKPENLELTDVLLLVLTCRHCRPWDKWELLCSSLILFILMLTFTFNHTSIVNWIIHLWSFARISIPFLSFVKLPHCKRAAKTKKKERRKNKETVRVRTALTHCDDSRNFFFFSWRGHIFRINLTVSHRIESSNQ